MNLPDLQQSAGAFPPPRAWCLGVSLHRGEAGLWDEASIRPHNKQLRIRVRSGAAQRRDERDERDENTGPASPRLAFCAAG